MACKHYCQPKHKHSRVHITRLGYFLAFVVLFSSSLLVGKARDFLILYGEKLVSILGPLKSNDLKINLVSVVQLYTCVSLPQVH